MEARNDKVITLEEWLGEIALHSPQMGRGHTVDEISKALGVSKQKARVILNELKQSNRIRVETGARENLIGRIVQVPVFVILPPPKKGK